MNIILQKIILYLLLKVGIIELIVILTSAIQKRYKRYLLIWSSLISGKIISGMKIKIPDINFSLIS